MGYGIQMIQAMPSKFPILFKHSNMAKFSENLVAIALTISVSMAVLSHMIMSIGGRKICIRVPAVI